MLKVLDLQQHSQYEMFPLWQYELPKPLLWFHELYEKADPLLELTDFPVHRRGDWYKTGIT